jgi:hypothetical protein
MRFVLRAAPSLQAGALLCLLSAPTAICAQGSAALHDEPVEAEFRGCDSAGWCGFWIEPSRPSEQPLRRVRPDGVAQEPGDGAGSLAIRNRLNALLASMIHQNKRILLQDLRVLDDGTFAATVTVNGENVASDPILMELRRKDSGTR